MYDLCICKKWLCQESKRYSKVKRIKSYQKLRWIDYAVAPGMGAIVFGKKSFALKNVIACVILTPSKTKSGDSNIILMSYYLKFLLISQTCK